MMLTTTRFFFATGFLFSILLCAPAGAGKAKWAHAPYGAGACETCHRSANPTSGALRGKVERICTSCHDEFAEQMAGRRHKHAPLAECAECHSPHEAGDARLLRASVSKVCADCHDKTSASCKKKRGAKGCVGCHDPHASDRPNLLK